jgi:hypothetical protein
MPVLEHNRRYSTTGCGFSKHPCNKRCFIAAKRKTTTSGSEAETPSKKTAAKKKVATVEAVVVPTAKKATAKKVAPSKETAHAGKAEKTLAGTVSKKTLQLQPQLLRGSSSKARSHREEAH